MSVDGSGVAPERFPLRDRAGEIALEVDGFHHPISARGRGRTFTRYADITHLALSDRFVWVGTKRAITMLARQRFRDSNAAERLLRALLARIGQRPGGAEQLARMADVEALARRPASLRVSWGLAALCVVGFLLDQLVGPSIYSVGHFSPILVADGDFWRIVTANLLHGFPLHLFINLLGLLIVGRMAERALGGARTICVMGAAALGAMATSGLLMDESVVGVSGVIFGLAGAVLWLEFRHGGELPAWWRFPRPVLRLVILAFCADVALGFFLPIIAGEAHLGGFVAGALATAALTRRTPLGAPESTLTRKLAVGVAATTLLAVGAAAIELVGEGDYVVRHAVRLAELPGVSSEDLNNHAWFIAIDPDSTHEHLDAALLLAERAVAQTGAAEATLLDTLAEVQFQLGWPEQAIATIDQAIAQEPHESYYREQRRRFMGERPADDRPPDPALRPERSRERRLPLPPDEAGLQARLSRHERRARV
jgi:membrane associated rhomboid family serine protease